jgi:hypothetical protein
VTHSRDALKLMVVCRNRYQAVLGKRLYDWRPHCKPPPLWIRSCESQIERMTSDC